MKHIPIEGGSANIESGPICFKNDWPGIFIRGDRAGGMASILRRIADAQTNEAYKKYLKELASFLGSSQI